MMFIALILTSLFGSLRYVNSQCIATPDEQLAMCKVAAGFDQYQMPTAMQPTWKCDVSNTPLYEPCLWYGVECAPVCLLNSALPCDTTCNINSLNLGGTGVGGTISSYIGQLTGLQGFFLYKNKMVGPIPPEIANLQELLYLEIDSNKFTGPFPRITFLEQPKNIANVQATPFGFVVGLNKLTRLSIDYLPLVTCYPSSIVLNTVIWQLFGQFGLWSLPPANVFTDPSKPDCGTYHTIYASRYFMYCILDSLDIYSFFSHNLCSRKTY
jgi:hypothetical protein